MRYFYYSIVIGLAVLIGVTVLKHSQQPQSIAVYVTVDWEGRSLDDEDIEAMQSFRQLFPHIPMLQLLNPVYFLRDHAYPERITATIQSTFLPIDTQGLHVHAWKSLSHYCGVPYQDSPSFADLDENCTTGDCGYTVSLELAYSQADLSKLIVCSNQVLVTHGFNRAVHFRAGGWQMGPKLIGALEENGFVWDSSKIDANLLMTRWHVDSAMVKMLKQLHPETTSLAQPYALSQQLMEYPNNAALADYTSTPQIVDLFEQLIDAKKPVMVLGFHQETAADYLGRLADAIPQMEAIAQEKGIRLQWLSQP